MNRGVASGRPQSEVRGKLRGAAAAAPRPALPGKQRRGITIRTGIALAVAISILIAISYALRPKPETSRETNAGSSDVRVDAGATAVLSQAPTKGSDAEIDRLIRAYEERAKTAPNVTEYTFLGRLYIEKGHLTGDVATYARAAEALERALSIAPGYVEAQSLLASVHLTTHDFDGALQLANELLDEDPRRFDALAVVGDAHLELGHYVEASEAYRRLASELPDTPAVLARRARITWLSGDVDEALDLARSATDQARKSGISGAGLSWYKAFEARIQFDAGNYAAAERAYQSALRTTPDYHIAMAGLARSLAAQGSLDEAIRLYERTASIVPEPDYLAALGDLYVLSGDDGQARDQYDTVEVIATLARINRQVFNRQLALFYADHDLKPRAALRLAADELKVRKDVYGYDVYAWALYRNGRFADARTASDRALSLGTQDPRLLYHSGMISAALGDRERAATELRAALDISPAFDPLQARTARRVLVSLGGRN